MTVAKSKRTSKVAAILPTPAAVIAPAVFEEQATAIKKQAAKAKKQAPVAPVETPPPAPRGLGIGALVKDLITQGLSNDEVLTKVMEQFPTASTNKGCVSWYRSDMKKKAAKLAAS
jgi:hypothetical protein